MGSLSPIRTEWTDHALASRLVLKPDMFLKSTSGGVPSKDRLPNIRFTPDFIKDLEAKIKDGAHFFFLDKPRSSIRNAFYGGKIRTPQEVLDEAIRSVKFTHIHELGDSIIETAPSFLDYDPSRHRLATKTIVFEPGRSYFPHTDYYNQKVLTTLSSSQILGDGEAFAPVEIGDLTPFGELEKCTALDHVNVKDSARRYVRKELFKTKDIEFIRLEDIDPEEGYIASWADWMVYHAAGNQNSNEPRRLDSVDVFASTKQDVERASYKRDLREARKDFIQGKYSYFDMAFEYRDT